MKKINQYCLSACLFCVFAVGAVFAVESVKTVKHYDLNIGGEQNKTEKNTWYEVLAKHSPRGFDMGYWSGYDTPIETPKESFIEGVGRGIVNAPAQAIKPISNNKETTNSKTHSNSQWNYRELGDNRGENKTGVFLGNIVGIALMFLIIWLTLIKSRKNKTFGWIVLFIVVVLPIHYKITMRNFDTKRNSNIKTQINTVQQHNDTPVNIKIDKKLQTFGDVNADNSSGLIKITTPEGATYSFNSFDNNAVDRLNKAMQNATPKQKEFLRYNEQLIRNAAGVFNFIRGNEYFINWCSRYYPVDNLRAEFNLFFMQKKIKAHDILSKAGLSEFETIVKENVGLQKAMEQKNNDMYEEIRKKSTQITSESEYCKRFDINAKNFVMELRKQFLFLFPNF